MSSASFLERLGFEGGRGDPAFAWRILAAVLFVYAIGFVVWSPSVPTNTDEAMFMNQTRLLLEGTTTAEKIDPLTGERFRFIERPYSNGFPGLMAPFVWIGGVRAGFWLPLLSVLAAVLLLGRWLSEEGHSPWFALLALGFPPTLVMGRVAMSDAPSLAIVCLGLWLFWRGLDRGWIWWLASGFVAGASMAVRVTNCLPFVSFFAGTVLRRDPRCLALLAGGLAGVGVRLAVSYLQFGDLFYERDSYRLALESIGERLPLYLLALLVLFPGGLIAGSAYRGRRWPELVAGVWLYFAVFLFQEFSTTTTGLAKRIVLALRYFLELLPLLVMATAEVAPRAWRALSSHRSERARRAMSVWAAALIGVWLLSVSGASLLVHAYMDRWGATQAAIAAAIHEHTGDDTVLIIDRAASVKFLRQIERRFQNVNMGTVTPEQVSELVRLHGKVFIAMLERSDSAYWGWRADRNRDFMESLEPAPQLIFDRHFTSTDWLRIWRLGGSDG